MTVLMHQPSHESKFWIPWITFVQLILSTYSHLSAFTGTFRFKPCIYWIIRLKNGIASSHMLCVKGQVGKGTATKVPLFSTTITKKILCLDPGLCTCVNNFQCYAIVVHMHYSMIFSMPRNFASHLYNCLLQRYVVIIYMHYDCLIMFV